MSYLVVPKITGDCTKPPIPEQYHYVEGKWNDGLVIQDESYNQFVWVPVGALPKNGNPYARAGSVHCDHQFGRRVEWFEYYYEDTRDETRKKQYESVGKYGGFYISRFTNSKSANGLPASVRGKKPWELYFQEALIAAQKIGQGKVQSHLLYGSEFDSIIEFAKLTGTSQYELEEDSTKLGNYKNSEGSLGKIAATGSNESWCFNRIYDLAGNVLEHTQERGRSNCHLKRGGNCSLKGDGFPVAYRVRYEMVGSGGFRSALCIE